MNLIKNFKVVLILTILITVLVLSNLIATFIVLLKTGAEHPPQCPLLERSGKNLAFPTSENYKDDRDNLRTSPIERHVSKMVQRLNKDKPHGRIVESFSYKETYPFPKVDQPLELVLDNDEKTKVTNLLENLKNWKKLDASAKKVLANEVKKQYIHFLEKEFGVAITYNLIEENREFFINYFSSLIRNHCVDSNGSSIFRQNLSVIPAM